MAEMEIDPPEAEVEGEATRRPLPVLSLAVLQTIRTAQAQHGLRHNDHARYRHAPSSSHEGIGALWCSTQSRVDISSLDDT